MKNSTNPKEKATISDYVISFIMVAIFFGVIYLFVIIIKYISLW